MVRVIHGERDSRRRASRAQSREEARRARAKGEIRIIRPEPVLARILRAREPLILSEEGYDWVVGWVEDVGAAVRSRENILWNIVMLVDYAVMDALLSLLPAELAAIVRGVRRR